MSNHFAIATVTAALRNFFLEALPVEVPEATATALRPDSPSGTLPRVGVNIFLFQVTGNSALSLEDWPTRTNGGALNHPPRVGMNLNYLFTFYGNEAELEPQRVLAAVIHRMNSQPWLDPEFIRRTLSLPEFAHLAESNLADAVERVKFTQLPLSLEELTKLWSVFQNTSYVLSVAYQASVVVLETPAPVRRPLPVFERNIRAAPFARVRLAEAFAEGPSRFATVAGTSIRIQGEGFAEPLAQVEIGRLALPSPSVRSSTEIAFVLSHADLRAGPFPLRLRTRAGFVTNSLPFLVRPTPTVTAIAGGLMTVQFDPAVGRRQKVELILNRLGAPAGQEPPAFVIPAPSQNGIVDPLIETTAAIAFDIVAVPAGDYLLRASVDGAENLLERAEVAGELVISDPKVTLP